MAIFANSFKYLLLVCISMQTVLSANQMVIYWGQNSAGAFTNVPEKQEKPLRNYCQDSSYDIIVVGFVYLFPSASGNADPTLPGMNFANHCEVPFDQHNPYVLNCTANVAPDIQYCQSRGKKIFLSFGGGVGTYGFTSDAQAITFANTVWNMFLGGNGAIRPFGNAVFDGVDLDIEGGSQVGYTQFISTLRSYFAAQTARSYYISSAPQCFYPDRLGPGAGTPLTEAWFDYIWIQFYNNHCGLDEYPQNFNFARWAAAISKSANPNVKLFIGAPASPDAAASGFVSLSTLQTIATAVSAAYPNLYGGMMVWDAATSDLYDDFAVSVAAFVHAASTPISAPVVISTPATTGVNSPSPVAGPITSGRARPSAAATTGAAPVVVTPPSTPVPTPAQPISAPSSSCTDGYMMCLSPTTYSKCNRGSWGVSQSCGINTECSPVGNYIYCVVPSIISTPISTPVPAVTPVVAPTPVDTPVDSPVDAPVATPIDAPVVSPVDAPVDAPVATPATPVDTPAATPVDTPAPTVTPVDTPVDTPAPVDAPSTTPVSPSVASVGSCESLGYQQCVGSDSYQTCSNGRNGFEWSIVQSCRTGLSCHASETANNIYCY